MLCNWPSAQGEVTAPQQALWQIFNDYAHQPLQHASDESDNAGDPPHQPLRVGDNDSQPLPQPSSSQGGQVHSFETIDHSTLAHYIEVSPHFPSSPNHLWIANDSHTSWNEEEESMNESEEEEEVKSHQEPQQRADPIFWPSPVRRSSTPIPVPMCQGMLDPIHFPSPQKDVTDTMIGFGALRKGRKRTRSPNQAAEGGGNDEHGEEGGTAARRPRRIRSPSPPAREAENRRAAQPRAADQPPPRPRNPPGDPFIIQDLGLRVNYR